MQLPLPFAWPPAEDERDIFVSDANAAAMRHLSAHALWPVRATILTGPRKSGRSLIGRVFVGQTGGTLIDDAETRDEEAIFHAWNAAQASRKPLLIVADVPPPDWAVTLPDLRSRLAATPRVAIGAPDDRLAGALIQKLFAQRGLAAGPDLIAWMVKRVERSYLGLARAVDAVDAAALAGQRRVTVPLARGVLGNAILSRQGEVAPQATEGEGSDQLSSESIPSPSEPLRGPPPPGGGG